MEKQLLQLRAFQTAFNAPMPEKPTMLDSKRAHLRQRLLQEEVTELKKAETLEDVSDAIIDSMYILLGTAHEYGIADRLSLMFDEVHSANMRKLGDDGKPIYRKDGKVLKPEGWMPPNLKTILSRRFHLLNSNNATFAEYLQAINEAENKMWEKKVERAVFRRMKWYDRILPKVASWFEKFAHFLERPIQKKIKVTRSTDNAYRGVVEIEIYGEKTEVVDY